MKSKTAARAFSVVMTTAVSVLALNPGAYALDNPKSSRDAVRDRRVMNQPVAAPAAEESTIQSQIRSIYQNFSNSYRLGTGDVIAIHVDKHPDDSVERIAVSPAGQVYYPLLGNINAGGKTISELQDFFTTSISQYIKDPKVTLSLLEANSAKIGVLGDVRVPGVLIMSHPMRVLDAITAVGGITDLGNSTDVTILRQYLDGRVQTINVNVKRILKGQANAEENVSLTAGDTIIVHGNKLKTLGTVSSLMGITSFLTLLGRRP
ncbi:MAG TPA: polysaccharide biosynthesis/export family protein [Blastocatellia bacterium]|nr:polysaccharide biosynthesis/export family protein [Blastocatellia bacterium]